MSPQRRHVNTQTGVLESTLAQRNGRYRGKYVHFRPERVIALKKKHAHRLPINAASPTTLHCIGAHFREMEQKTSAYRKFRSHRQRVALIFTDIHSERGRSDGRINESNISRPGDSRVRCTQLYLAVSSACDPGCSSHFWASLGSQSALLKTGLGKGAEAARTRCFSG